MNDTLISDIRVSLFEECPFFNINKTNAKNPLHEKYFNYLSSWHDT